MKYRPIWIGLLILLALLSFTRFFFFLRFFIIFAFLAAGVGFLIYWINEKLNNRNKTHKLDPVIQQILTRINYCQTQIDRYQKEIDEIQENIGELKSQTENDIDLSEQNRQETIRILQEFEAELKLRQSKITFFKTCIQKLSRIQKNRLVAKSLLEKEERLKQLQQENYDNIAKIESLKSEIDFDLTFLETIDNLSNELGLSSSFSDAEKLNRELIQITRGLK